jgi:hypothetical protein
MARLASIAASCSVFGLRWTTIPLAPYDSSSKTILDAKTRRCWGLWPFSKLVRAIRLHARISGDANASSVAEKHKLFKISLFFKSGHYAPPI